jgi:hypothetical protein
MGHQDSDGISSLRAMPFDSVESRFSKLPIEQQLTVLLKLYEGQEHHLAALAAVTVNRVGAIEAAVKTLEVGQVESLLLLRQIANTLGVGASPKV